MENSTYVFLRIVVPLLLHLFSCLPDLVSIYHLSSSVIVLINESETEVIRCSGNVKKLVSWFKLALN